MNGFDAAAILTPLTFYFGYLTWVHYRRKAVSGPADWGMLGIGLSGFVFLGPLPMLIPIEALIAKGGLVWILMMMLYWLGFLLIGLLRPTRGIIYGWDPASAQEAFHRFARLCDADAQIAGKTAYLPNSGLNLTLTCSAFSETAVVAVLNRCPAPEMRIFFDRLLKEAFPAQKRRINRHWLIYPVLFLLTAAFLLGVGITSEREIVNGIFFYLFS